MATLDFTQYLLNDPHAPMLAVSLEEQTLAPARVLGACHIWSTSLALCSGAVRQLTSQRPLHLPSRRHADLATYLATVLVGLFDPARLKLLPEALADYRKLGDPNVVARALLVQINYIVDVAANMPANTHTTASGVFRLAWRVRQNSTTIVLHLRTVNMYLPQPSRIVPAQLACGHAAANPVASGCTSPVAFVHARCKFECPLSLPGPFVDWYMSRLRTRSLCK